MTEYKLIINGKEVANGIVDDDFMNVTDKMSDGWMATCDMSRRRFRSTPHSMSTDMTRLDVPGYEYTCTE